MFAGKNAFIKLQPFVLCSRPNLRRVSRSLYTMFTKKESMILWHSAKKRAVCPPVADRHTHGAALFFPAAHAVSLPDAAHTFSPWGEQAGLLLQAFPSPLQQAALHPNYSTKSTKSLSSPYPAGGGVTSRWLRSSPMRWRAASIRQICSS